MQRVTLSDELITALSRLIDDGQTEAKREPTHSTLTFHFQKAGLLHGDPAAAGQTVGKAKRLRGVLNWALENAEEAGGALAVTLIGVIRGCGGFRESSSNYVGRGALADAIAAFREDGYALSEDGVLGPLLLDNLSRKELTQALRNYVRRAQRGSLDAALVAGTGKDLMEAVAKHVLTVKFGSEPAITNVPTLVAQAFMAFGLCIDAPQALAPQQRVDAALYDLACAVNALRNAQGTGHGRPFPPSVSDDEARTAIESTSVICERLLSLI
jgi:hypothetical protein